MFPDLVFETELAVAGYRCVAGVDEVGMGCLAGPVVACAVVLTDSARLPDGINDSKKLSPKKRQSISDSLKELGVDYCVGLATVEEVDFLNIYQAARLAMLRAVSGLKNKPDFLLIDGRTNIDLPILQKPIVKGDQKSVSIACASILAKVYRDSLMLELNEKYPGYDFANNKGYGSISHRSALTKLGPTHIHRTSFSWKPV